MGQVHRGVTGGIVRAAAALDEHRAAALYDFRHRFQAKPTDFSSHERILLAAGVLRDHFSHLAAAEAGWLYAPSVHEWVFYIQMDRDNRSNTPQKDLAQWRPIPRPWEKQSEKPRLTDQTRAKLHAHAKRMTGRRLRG